jgi:hypothetical protein
MSFIELESRLERAFVEHLAHIANLMTQGTANCRRDGDVMVISIPLNVAGVHQLRMANKRRGDESFADFMRSMGPFPTLSSSLRPAVFLNDQGDYKKIGNAVGAIPNPRDPVYAANRDSEKPLTPPNGEWFPLIRRDPVEPLSPNPAATSEIKPGDVVYGRSAVHGAELVGHALNAAGFELPKPAATMTPGDVAALKTPTASEPEPKKEPMPWIWG